MDGDHVARLRLRAFALLHDFVLQAGLGGDHAFALAVVLEELLAGLGGFFVQLDQALFGTLLQEGEGLGQLFIGQLLLLLGDSILDAQGDSLGIQVIHAFLDQTLAHVQADAIGRLLRRGGEFYLGLRIAAGENQPDQSDGHRQPMLFHAEFLSLSAMQAYR
ncbi:hypothetical protein D3C76_1244550 [compost metagenome]